METSIIVSGFGGQGALFAGQLLAYAAMDSGQNVTWIPSYGPEMRGGTCNCTVVISDRPVGSPVIQSPRAIVAMNLPSLDKFEPNLKTGGLCLINTSLIERDTERDDVNFLKHSLAFRQGDGRPRIEWSEVTITRSQPGVRDYSGDKGK